MPILGVLLVLFHSLLRIVPDRFRGPCADVFQQREGKTSQGKTSQLDIPALSVYYGMESELDMARNVQNRVKEFRTDRGWTQQQLAEAVGVSRQSINSIERNRYVPSLLLALTFSRVFSRPTDDIFTLEIQK